MYVVCVGIQQICIIIVMGKVYVLYVRQGKKRLIKKEVEKRDNK